MSGTHILELPPWSVVSEKRRAHIARVTSLLDEWAMAMSLSIEEGQAWHDAGRWHDALRDESAETLQTLAGPHAELPPRTWHGPAAAVKLQQEGERRSEVIDAIRWHTLGSPTWERTGRALYMADFLEPGRSFDREARAALAARVPQDFDGTFREVVRMRLVHTLNEGQALFPQSVKLWNAVR